MVRELFMEDAAVKTLARIVLLGVFVSMLLTASLVWPQEKNGDQKSVKPGRLALARAAVCEEIRDYAPYHPAIAFSISVGKVSCFSLFDPVPEKTFITHYWYHRDKLSTKKRLTLKPPRWATVSTIQLRQTDKGPWRVEITDQKGRVFKILRFSVTD